MGARSASESGFTLIELVIAMALTVVIAGAMLTFMITSLHQGNEISSHAAATGQAEQGLEQLVQDLRDAMAQNASGSALSVQVSNPTSATTAISFDIPTPGADTTPQTDTWTCPSTGATTEGTCTRSIAGGSARQEIRGVVSATFAPLSSSGVALTLPATNPSYIGITLDVQVTSQIDSTQSHVVTGITTPIIVQTGADLRTFA